MLANQACQDPDCISLMHQLKQSEKRIEYFERKVEDLEAEKQS